MTTRFIRASILVPAAFAAAALGAPQAASAGDSKQRTARVVRVVDGDTMVLTTPRGAKRYDLLGVDAPELSDCFGRTAQRRLRTLLPAGSRVRVVARKRGARKVVVLRRGTGVNRLVVQSGHARGTLRDGTKLARSLAAAQTAALEAERGLWGACEQDQEAVQREAERPEAPTVVVPPERFDDADDQPAPPAAADKTRLGRTEFLAFLEDSSFERVRTSSAFGGSSSRLFVEFCTADAYRLQTESFNNGFVSGSNEAGTWKLLRLTRLQDVAADEGRIELVTQDSDDAEFNASSPESERTFAATVTVFDDGRIRLNDEPAQRAAAAC